MRSLSPILIDIEQSCSSQKKVFELLAKLAATALPLNVEDVFEALLKREKLGTTGIGLGVAMPQAVVEGLTSQKTIFLRLRQTVNFNAIDDEPVDIIFCHLTAFDTPDQDRLLTLSRLSKILLNKDLLSTIRGVETRSAIQAIFDEVFSD